MAGPWHFLPWFQFLMVLLGIFALVQLTTGDLGAAEENGDSGPLHPDKGTNDYGNVVKTELHSTKLVFWLLQQTRFHYLLCWTLGVYCAYHYTISDFIDSAPNVLIISITAIGMLVHLAIRELGPADSERWDKAALLDYLILLMVYLLWNWRLFVTVCDQHLNVTALRRATDQERRNYRPLDECTPKFIPKIKSKSDVEKLKLLPPGFDMQVFLQVLRIVNTYSTAPGLMIILHLPDTEDEARVDLKRANPGVSHAWKVGRYNVLRHRFTPAMLKTWSKGGAVIIHACTGVVLDVGAKLLENGESTMQVQGGTKNNTALKISIQKNAIGLVKKLKNYIADPETGETSKFDSAPNPRAAVDPRSPTGTPQSLPSGTENLERDFPKLHNVRIYSPQYTRGKLEYLTFDLQRQFDIDVIDEEAIDGSDDALEDVDDAPFWEIAERNKEPKDQRKAEVKFESKPWSCEADIPDDVMPEGFPKAVLLRIFDLLDRLNDDALVVVGPLKSLPLDKMCSHPKRAEKWRKADDTALNIFQDFDDITLKEWTLDGAVAIHHAGGDVIDITAKLLQSESIDWCIEGGFKKDTALKCATLHSPCLALCRAQPDKGDLTPPYILLCSSAQCSEKATHSFWHGLRQCLGWDRKPTVWKLPCRDKENPRIDQATLRAVQKHLGLEKFDWSLHLPGVPDQAGERVAASVAWNESSWCAESHAERKDLVNIGAEVEQEEEIDISKLGEGRKVARDVREYLPTRKEEENRQQQEEGGEAREQKRELIPQDYMNAAHSIVTGIQPARLDLFLDALSVDIMVRVLNLQRGSSKVKDCLSQSTDLRWHKWVDVEQLLGSCCEKALDAVTWYGAKEYIGCEEHPISKELSPEKNPLDLEEITEHLLIFKYVLMVCPQLAKPKHKREKEEKKEKKEKKEREKKEDEEQECETGDARAQQLAKQKVKKSFDGSTKLTTLMALKLNFNLKSNAFDVWQKSTRDSKAAKQEENPAIIAPWEQKLCELPKLLRLPSDYEQAAKACLAEALEHNSWTDNRSPQQFLTDFVERKAQESAPPESICSRNQDILNAFKAFLSHQGMCTDLEIFGSHAMNFAVHSSDLDLHLMPNELELHLIRSKLQEPIDPDVERHLLSKGFKVNDVSNVYHDSSSLSEDWPRDIMALRLLIRMDYIDANPYVPVEVWVDPTRHPRESHKQLRNFTMREISKNEPHLEPVARYLKSMFHAWESRLKSHGLLLLLFYFAKAEPCCGQGSCLLLRFLCWFNETQYYDIKAWSEICPACAQKKYTHIVSLKSILKMMPVGEDVMQYDWILPKELALKGDVDIWLCKVEAMQKLQEKCHSLLHELVRMCLDTDALLHQSMSEQL